MNIMLLFVGFLCVCVCGGGGGCWYVIDHLDYVLFSPGGGGGGDKAVVVYIATQTFT